MRKILVILLASSILLTQCYTQNEYLTKDYVFNTEDDLKKVVLTDSTEKEFSFNQFDYKIESDSLLITYSSRKEIIGNKIQFITVTDTLKIEQFHSLIVSEYDGGLVTLSIVTAGLVLLGVITWAEMGYW